MRNRAAALISTVLAIATATFALPGSASAVVPGIKVQFTQLPKTFAAGSDPSVVTVVASTDEGRTCRKVRWSMLLRVQGPKLDQVRVDRLEGDASFPIDIQTDGDTARLTDKQLDPGSLCPGGTVTATYAIAFSGGAGAVTMEVQAFDTADRLLQSATANSRVGNGDAATPAPTPSESADPAPAPSESDGTGGAAGYDPPASDAASDTQSAAPPAADIPQSRASANSGIPSLLGPGLIIGALLVFLGIGLLLRLRSRAAKRDRHQHLQPTSFYPTL